VAAKRSSRVGAGAVVVLALIIGFLAFSKARHLRFAPPIGSGCLVQGRGFDIPLTSDQAGLAAIIAGVAAHRSMPARAVAIAYAAALQESDLENLTYGDLDSVGVFQQRPSQGWGTRRQLLDPVFASSRFFQALAAVPRYRHLQIYQAAQAVQHSADGHAYSQYSGQGAAMADGFTGQRPHDVWCWYTDGISGRRRLAAAGQQLIRAFGKLHIGHVGDPGMDVRVPNRSAGWAVAAWLVTHAKTFGIRTVNYDGYRWSAAHGQAGWHGQSPAPAGSQPSPRHRERPSGTARDQPAGRLAVTFG
jgi:hypothetical protein